MGTSIERLRASKAEFESTNYAEGVIDGTFWAANFAEYLHLMRLERFNRQRPDWRDSFDPETSYFRLYQIIELGSELEVFEFWEQVLHANEFRYTAHEYVKGFVGGALGVLWQEKNQP